MSLLRPLKYLRSPPKPFKSLKLQVNLALKRLASAVQLRPWPPCFQRLASHKNRILGAIRGISTRPESAKFPRGEHATVSTLSRFSFLVEQDVPSEKLATIHEDCCIFRRGTLDFLIRFWTLPERWPALQKNPRARCATFGRRST